MIFDPHYEIFAAQPGLSRLFLRELLFYDSGAQALRALRIRADLMRTIVDVIDADKQIGEIRSRGDSEAIAYAFFAQYQFEIRRWLGMEPVALSDGLQHLRQSLDLLMDGLAINREVTAVDLRRVLASIRPVDAKEGDMDLGRPMKN